ncbi:hypothetical protein UFOVP386_24 [uncultured Caudovirales phage]|uniref:Uncharacterized protein n=1 Tax=uncultured Caudovirales phage TaxID=2100421 RepID=A0A6J7X1K9_9CAUD|nr:hypothetical protein UFOVP386_24 [uncultured Caudovirales phage]
MITSTIYGLTGVGNDAYTGMIMSRNDVVITASSSDYAQPNFKYIFSVENIVNGQILKFYQEQNFNNCASFNLKGVVMNMINESINISPSNDIITTAVELITNNIFTAQISIRVFSGWDIGGIFTEDSNYDRYDLMVLDGEGDDCYIPLGVGGHQTAGALVEKNESRLNFNPGGTYNVDLKDIRISFREGARCTWFMVPRRKRFIPNGDYYNWQVHDSSHYRSLVFVADDGTYLSDFYPYRNIGYIQIKCYDYDSMPIGTGLDIPFLTSPGALFVVPAGLQNLYESGYLALMGITDSSLVKFWIISFLDEAGTSSIFDNYGFYIEDECSHNEVSLTWLNRFGGWESMGFVKKNERSIQTEKKRIMNIEGNYATATPNDFNINYTSRLIKEKEPIKTHSMILTSGWINEEEFRRLKYLISSRSVWMEDSNFDGGKILPVLVETNNFTSRRERNNKKYNITIELRMAYSKRNLDLFNTHSEGDLSALELTPPEPACRYAFATGHSGNSGLVPTYYQTPIPIACDEIGSHHHINLAVLFDDDTQFEEGQHYCIKLDWSSEMPTEILSSADLGTIEINGNGSNDIYWTGQAYPLTTGWISVLKTTTNSPYIDIRVPNFPSKARWTGMLTLHIKKVSESCPCGGY